MVSSQTVTFLSWSELDKQTCTWEESSKQVIVCNVSSIRVILLQWNTELQLQSGRAAPDPLSCLLLILFMAGSNKIFRSLEMNVQMCQSSFYYAPQIFSFNFYTQLLVFRLLQLTPAPWHLCTFPTSTRFQYQLWTC